jgi:hypothetical protein
VFLSTSEWVPHQSRYNRSTSCSRSVVYRSRCSLLLLPV